jgi:hypothetical protein
MSAKPQELSSSVALRCLACGRHDDGVRGWRVYIPDDPRSTTEAFCPECAERELGEDER